MWNDNWMMWNDTLDNVKLDIRYCPLSVVGPIFGPCRAFPTFSNPYWNPLFGLSQSTKCGAKNRLRRAALGAFFQRKITVWGAKTSLFGPCGVFPTFSNPYWNQLFGISQSTKFGVKNRLRRAALGAFLNNSKDHLTNNFKKIFTNNFKRS